MQTLLIRSSMALTACSAKTSSLIFTPRHSGVKGTDASASGYSGPMDLRVIGGIFQSVAQQVMLASRIEKAAGRLNMRAVA